MLFLGLSLVLGAGTTLRYGAQASHWRKLFLVAEHGLWGTQAPVVPVHD